MLVASPLTGPDHRDPELPLDIHVHFPAYRYGVRLGGGRSKKGDVPSIVGI
jgi:hypothetical protein